MEGEENRMDLVPELPVELSQLVMRFLSVNDLGRCLTVSKKWRNLANCDLLWKQHCHSYGLLATDAKRSKSGVKTDLCKWAKIWLRFRQSSAFGWHMRIWRTRELDPDSVYVRSISDGESLVICTGSELTVRKVSQLGKTKYTLQIPLPSDSCSSLAVDNRFIAVAKCNIALVYKFVGNRYQCCMAVSMNGDTVLKTRTYVHRFIKNHLIPDSACISIIALSKGCLWFREHSRYKTYIVNIPQNKLSTVEAHFYRFTTKSFIVSWSRKHLRVDSFTGKNLLKLCRHINKARANNHILVTFGFIESGEESNQMETWEMSSGKKLYSSECPREAFFELHPSKDILYQIQIGQTCIRALCPLSGNELWKVDTPPSIKGILDWCMRVVCERYLVLFRYKSTIPNHTTIYVFHALTGAYMYRAERPPGLLEHLSDNLLISKINKKIYLRTFH